MLALSASSEAEEVRHRTSGPVAPPTQLWLTHGSVLERPVPFQLLVYGIDYGEEL